MTAVSTPAQRSTVARKRALCEHCSLPVPKGSRSRFCCGGCEAAYNLIRSCGLDKFYDLKCADNLDTANGIGKAHAKQSAPDRSVYAAFDDPAFASLYCTTLEDGAVQTELLLEGLHCAACVWLVERLDRVVPGVIDARLDVRRASVTVRFDPSRTTLSQIGRGLDSLGYPPHPARRTAVQEARRDEDRRMLVRVAVAGACAGNIMLLFFALYAGMFEGIEREYEQLFRWAAMLLNTLCLAWPGLVFARSALAAIRTRTINLDVPIAMGLYLGGAWGIWKTVAGSGDLYFDSISALIFFLLIGRMIQMRQQRYAADALELLFSIGASTARRVDADGTITEVATESLSPGDLLEVRAGETVPSDGVIVQGASKFDQSMLTGESRPCRLEVDDEVAAGTINVSSPIRMRVTATGESTRIGRLMRMVEEAGRRRAPIVLLADRWGAWLLWGLLLLAAVTIALWWHVSPALAIDRAAALLIATCPCGLGLATPLVMTVAMGQAAKQGMLVKGGDVFERLARGKGTIFLDKTGTITRGVMAVLRWHGDRSIESLVRGLESLSSHPIARALSSAPGETLPAFEDVVEVPGKGIAGRVPTSRGARRRLFVGSQRYLIESGVSVSDELVTIANECGVRGNSAVFVALDEECVAVIEMGDPIRHDAADAIRRLSRMGWHVRVLSGDRCDVTAATAERVGIQASSSLGGASPEEKLAVIQKAIDHETVIMVGDGVNDAAALAAATVGIAVRGGAEASLAAADVSLRQEGLAPVVELIAASKRVLGTIHLTIATSLGYNVIAASLAMAGLINPLLAAIIMPASSLTVVAICLRSKPFASRQRTGGRP